MIYYEFDKGQARIIRPDDPAYLKWIREDCYDPYLDYIEGRFINEGEYEFDDDEYDEPEGA